MRLSTTFALLREQSACTSGYQKLAKHLGGVRKHGKHTPIDLLTILESNGIADALWSLRAVLPAEREGMRRLALLYSADCCEHRLPDDVLAQRIVAALRQVANKQPHEDLRALYQVADLAYRSYLADRADRAYLAYRSYLADLADLADRSYLAYRADRANRAYLANRANLADRSYLADLAARADRAWCEQRFREVFGDEPVAASNLVREELANDH